MATHLRVASIPGEARRAPVPVEQPIRVVLADDHVLMRRSLRLLLDGEEDVVVVAEAGDHHTAVRHVHGHQPDVLVLDLRMSDGAGIESVRAFSERAPATRTVVLTMEDDPVFAQRALTAGALGFVAKDLADVE